MGLPEGESAKVKSSAGRHSAIEGGGGRGRENQATVSARTTLLSQMLFALNAIKKQHHNF